MAQNPEALVPFIPMIILLGTVVFFKLLGRCRFRQKISKNLILIALVVINCWPVLVEEPPAGDRLGEVTLYNLESIGNLIRREELVATDIPEMVCWYANRRAVPIPVNPDMFKEMLKNNPRIKFLLLTPHIMDAPGQDPTAQWREVYLRRSLPWPSVLEQKLLLPGSTLLMGKKPILLNRISSRW